VSGSDLFYDRYTLDGTDEWMMRIGPAGRPALLFLSPMFEEMNRTRALLAATMRGLAARGWTCLLPDLPGTGESPRRLEDCSWDNWIGAVRAVAAATNLAAVASLRGGALLDHEAGVRRAWRLSPVDGVALLRDLERAGRVSNGGTAGYAPSRALAGPMSQAVPGARAGVRTIRLASDPGEAALKLDSPPIWRRAEPQSSPELAALMASDIDAWLRI
jgi:pimeloyl-ACP methyl ester carboxylesterase